MRVLAFGAWWRLAQAAARTVATWLTTITRRDGDRDDFSSHATRGDVVLALGSPWSHPEYARLVRTQREQNGLRFSLSVHDLVVLRCPEWCGRDLARVFPAWFFWLSGSYPTVAMSLLDPGRIARMDSERPTTSEYQIPRTNFAFSAAAASRNDRSVPVDT
jgi:hypothetical protein